MVVLFACDLEGYHTCNNWGIKNNVGQVHMYSQLKNNKVEKKTTVLFAKNEFPSIIICFECITCICSNGFLIMYSWTLPCNVDIDSCNVHVPGLKSINPYHIIDLLG